MAHRRPVIIEAAINGPTPAATNPNVPRTPERIAACALECLDRGAAIVHNHNDEPNIGGPARHDPEPYAAAWTEVLARRPHALLHPTVRGMSADAPIEDRYSHLDALFDRGLLPMASADPGVVAIGPFLYGNSSTDADYMSSGAAPATSRCTSRCSSPASSARCWCACTTARCRSW